MVFMKFSAVLESFAFTSILHTVHVKIDCPHQNTNLSGNGIPSGGYHEFSRSENTSIKIDASTVCRCDYRSSLVSHFNACNDIEMRFLIAEIVF
jgi:hypothetical protein